jgi:hypothetical protein
VATQVRGGQNVRRDGGTLDDRVQHPGRLGGVAKRNRITPGTRHRSMIARWWGWSRGTSDREPRRHPVRVPDMDNTINELAPTHDDLDITNAEVIDVVSGAQDQWPPLSGRPYWPSEPGGTDVATDPTAWLREQDSAGISGPFPIFAELLRGQYAQSQAANQ